MSPNTFSWLMAGYVIAVGGTALHDVAEFGAPSIQNTIPFVILAGALLFVWRRWPRLARAAQITLFAFVMLALIGGGLASVLPLAFWPWKPEQSAEHYLVHVAWTISLAVFAWVIFKQKWVTA
ncbi:MAG: hypothetical protein AAB217_11775 [Chloroflexota bacterium]